MTVPVTTALDAGVLTISFARPEKKNAITDAMYGVVADALLRLIRQLPPASADRHPRLLQPPEQ